MPRSASPPFNYVVPTGTAAVSGQVISSVAYNTFLSDLTNNALNSAWPVAYGGNGTTDGSALLPDGSNATPSVRFQSETNTGFYRVGAGDIGISILGTKVGDITAAGINIPFAVPISTTSTITSTGSSVNYTAFSGVSTDAGALAGPIFDLYRNSASPAVNDIIPQVSFNGKDASALKTQYGAIYAVITGLSVGQPSGQLVFSTIQGGSVADKFKIAGGLFSTNATGGDQGNNTINVSNYYKNGSYGVIQLGTSVASTSGATIDFTGLPVGVSRITFTFYLLSTTGTSPLLVQIGDSGGVETTGYLSGGTKVNNGSSPDSTATTTGFILEGGTVAASDTYMGTMILTKQDTAGTIWLAFGNMNRGDAGGLPTYIFSGGKTLSPGPLDRVRLTTVGGTATFDGGTVNISYE